MDRVTPTYSQTFDDASDPRFLSAPLFKRNEGRRALLLQNKSAVMELFVSFNGPASADSLRLGPRQTYAEHRIPPGNDIWLWSPGSCMFFAYEG